MSKSEIHEQVNNAQIEGLLILISVAVLMVVMALLLTAFTYSLAIGLDTSFIDITNNRIKLSIVNFIIENNNLNEKQVFKQLSLLRGKC